jgi:hypothetical protein
VGHKWDDVYAQLKHEITGKNADHIIKECLWEVETSCFYDGQGRLAYAKYGYLNYLDETPGTLYVDPLDGVLKSTPPQKTKTKYQQTAGGYLTTTHLLLRYDGLWFQVPIDKVTVNPRLNAELNKRGYATATANPQSFYHSVRLYLTHEFRKIRDITLANYYVGFKPHDKRQLNAKETHKLLVSLPDLAHIDSSASLQRIWPMGAA